MLQPKEISEFYTLEEIVAEIARLKTAIDLASESKSDSFSDFHANQKVERQSLTEMKNYLSVWLKAWGVKTGSPSSTAELIAANYNPSVPTI